MTRTLEADDVVAAVEAAHREGETDALEGGVARAEIASRVDRSESSERLGDLLERLVDDGVLVEVWGVNPDSGYSRKSFLPADAEEVASDFPDP